MSHGRPEAVAVFGAPVVWGWGYLTLTFVTLTAGQLKMASMIIIGADNRLIARTLNISAESVWKGRYRLRQRL